MKRILQVAVVVLTVIGATSLAAAPSVQGAESPSLSERAATWVADTWSTVFAWLVVDPDVDVEAPPPATDAVTTVGGGDPQNGPSIDPNG